MKDSIARSVIHLLDRDRTNELIGWCGRPGRDRAAIQAGIDLAQAVTEAGSLEAAAKRLELEGKMPEAESGLMASVVVLIHRHGHAAIAKELSESAKWNEDAYSGEAAAKIAQAAGFMAEAARLLKEVEDDDAKLEKSGS